MNRIEVDHNKMDLELEKDILFCNHTLTVEKNTLLLVILNHSEVSFTVDLLENVQLQLYMIGKDANINIQCHEKTNSHLVFCHFGMNIDGTFDFFLEGRNSENQFYNSIINQQDHRVFVSFHHDAMDTCSHVFDHIWNHEKSSIQLEVNGIVPKKSSNCICSQDNQIIEYHRSNSSIKPNLYIDNQQIQASHSAYIGRFKKEDLFYLQSRGLSQEDSYYLMRKAFLLGKMPLESCVKELYFQKLFEWGR